MRRVILLLFILLAITVLAYGRTPAQLSGTGGMALLNDLTNNSINNSANFSAANNTTANLSHSKKLVPLSGDDGTTLLTNLTNDPANLSWGSEPRRAPLPPSYADAMYARIIHDNRG